MSETAYSAGKVTNQAGACADDAEERLGKVCEWMARLKVAGLPRNYELFHEALFGEEPVLARELSTVPASPPQSVLDQIGLKYRLPGHCGHAETSLHREAGDVLKGVSALLSEGVAQKRLFQRALETIVRSVREDEGRGIQELLAELDYLGAAAAALIRREDDLALRIDASLEAIEAAERSAEKAALAMLRDRLTHLPNRIAFNNRLTALYGGEANVRGTALALAEIRDFDAWTRKHGPEAAARTLKRLATIFRKTVKREDFVARTATGEFAFLFGQVTPETARHICERLQATVAERLVRGSDPHCRQQPIALSIGLGLCDEALSPPQLLGQAEAALTAARLAPRQPVITYTAEIGRQLAGRATRSAA